MADEILLTKEKLEEVKKELEHLINVERPTPSATRFLNGVISRTLSASTPAALPIIVNTAATA